MRSKLLTSVAFVGGLIFGAQASAVVINGIEIEAGDQLWTTTLWETVLTDTSSTLSGVGIVEAIKRLGVGDTWTTGQNDTQLTYHFHDFTVLAWYEINGTKHSLADDGAVAWAASAGFGFAHAIDFAGGFVDMYTDLVSVGTVLDGTAIGGTQAGDIADATDGLEWAKYVGHTFDYSSVLGGAITDRLGGSLYGSATGGSSVHADGFGFGYLDIASGPAFSNLDTDSFHPETDDVVGDADASFTSSFNTLNANHWPLSGSATVQTHAVPEPSLLALMAIGLLSLAGIQRRKLQ